MGHTDESLDLDQSRRSTRERKQTQYFGYADSDTVSEELVSCTLNGLLRLIFVALAFLRSSPVEVHD